MRIRTPRRWYLRDSHPSLLERGILGPASFVWAAATSQRLAHARPIDPGVPVVCVGNLTVGGSGKTPVAKAIAGRLRDLGLRAHFLARGHGGRLSGPVLVDPRQHTAREVGDEALVLAADGPVWVARNRAAGARSAASGGAQVIVMDDGHQNASVTKTLSLVAVDGETRRGEWPFGDGAIFPRGPLREPISSGLARANAVVVLLPADLPEVDPALRDLLEGSTLLVARLEPLSPPPVGLQVGFAGIAKPWRMKQALEAAGCHLADFIAFPDHGPISESDLRGLARRAAFLGADLITSEKDWVRLPPEWRARMTAWPVRAIFEDQQALDKLLSALGASPTPLTRPP